ncbi:MAG: roadblock/LC7 domain-containing protein [bacterium]
MEGTKKGIGQQLILSEEIYNGIADILNELAGNTRADTIIFCETNGYPVTYKGDIKDLDLPSISALAANNFSATAKMASMIGERASFKFLFHEGERTNIYLSNVGFNFLLMLIFDKSVALGMVRVFTNKAIQALTKLLETAKAEEEKSKEFLDLEFKTLLGEELDRSLKL